MRNSSISGRLYYLSRVRSLRNICLPYSTRFCNNAHSGIAISKSPKPVLGSFGPEARVVPIKPACSLACVTLLRRFTSSPEQGLDGRSDKESSDEEVEPIDSWEEEDEADPELGDGGDGGGIVLQNCLWGERALSIARQVLLQYGEDMELYAFKTSPRGYIYVRLDKLSNEYGCPSMDEIESFNREYKQKLNEIGASGEIPDDLALEVSSPGADRLLRVPDDLLRFKDMPMVVSYSEDSHEKNRVFFLDSIETESSCCIWKLADVKENRDPSSKGRPLSRKQRDCRFKLPYSAIKRITLYINY